MIKYIAIIKDNSPYFFYKNNGDILFEVNKKYSFPQYRCKVKNSQGDDLFQFEVVKILTTKIKIVYQDLDKIISLKKEKHKYKLKVDKNTIYLNEKPKVFGNYEASIVVNEKVIGVIKESNKYPYKKYFITFDTEDDINFYCLILFTIISVHFAVGV